MSLLFCSKLQQLSPGRGDFGSDFRSAPAALPRAAPAFEPEPLHRDYRERQHAAPAAGHAHKGASYLDDLNMQMEAKRAREKLDRERENAAERARLELDAAPARGGAHRDAAAPRRVSALPEPHDDTNKLSKQVYL